MKILYYILSGLLFFPLSLPAQDEIGEAIEKQLHILEKDSNNLSALKEVSMLYLKKADFNKAIYHGKRLQNLAYSIPQNPYYCLYSHIILGQGYTMKGNRNKAYNNLGQAKASAERAKNDSALCSIYNGLGLYAANLDKDYYRSISYYFEGLETAKKCRYEKLYSILLSNLSSIYYLKKDTAGLQYSLECYERGHELKDVYLILIGSETTALMYYLRQDYQQALNYIKEAEFIVLKNKFYNQTDIYTLYGMTLSALHNDGLALEYFSQALQYESTSQPTSILHAYIQYAQTLIKLKRYNEALHLLQRGELYIKEKNIVIYKGELYKTLSLLYEQTTHFDKALKYQKIYQLENDSMFNITKEQAINDLRIKYYSQKLENEINEARVEKLKKEKKIELMSACIIAILLVTGTLFYLYRRKNKLYRAIVQQNQQAIQREKNLLKQIEGLKKPTKPSEAPVSASFKYTGSSLSNEKVSDLFNRLETLMREKRVYTDNMITKEKVSEMLNTNRTYLSQAINDQAGKTFTQYVNEFRTREAIERLSNPKETIPLKALSAELGFNSMTTFYNLFQAMTGMTPTQYRNSVQELEKR